MAMMFSSPYPRWLRVAPVRSVNGMRVTGRYFTPAGKGLFGLIFACIALVWIFFTVASLQKGAGLMLFGFVSVTAGIVLGGAWLLLSSGVHVLVAPSFIGIGGILGMKRLDRGVRHGFQIGENPKARELEHSLRQKPRKRLSNEEMDILKSSTVYLSYGARRIKIATCASRDKAEELALVLNDLARQVPVR